MIVQNSPTPWMVLALVIMLGCVVTGMMLGNVGPFNSEATYAKLQITQTQASINAFSTQSSIDLIQTRQAPLVQQTIVSAQMTAFPLQQTATSIAESNMLQNSQIDATQTAIVANSQNGLAMSNATQTTIGNSSYMQNLITNATATAIAQEQVNRKLMNISSQIALWVGIITVSGLLLIHAQVRLIVARSQEKAARARLLSEQAKLVSIHANIKSQRQYQSNQNIVSSSLIKRPGNGKGIPRAE